MEQERRRVDDADLAQKVKTWGIYWSKAPECDELKDGHCGLKEGWNIFITSSLKRFQLAEWTNCAFGDKL